MGRRRRRVAADDDARRPLYENATPAAARLPGTTSATKFLRQTGTGSASAVPAWDTLQSGDVPVLNQSTTGNAATATNLAGGATFPAYVAPKVTTLTQSGGNVAVDASLGNDCRLSLTASGWTISNPVNPVNGQDLVSS